MRLNDDEDALLVEVAARHGGVKPAIVAGLKLLQGANDIDLAAALERAAAELRRLQKATAESPEQQAERIKREAADRAAKRFAKRPPK